MKFFRSAKLCVLVIFAVLWSSILSAAGVFVATTDGIKYVVKNSSGQTIKVITPDFDPASGNYVAKENNRVIAAQSLPNEAGMSQFKLVSPLNGSAESTYTKDFMGNKIPILKPLSTSDPRYTQLKSYIESNKGLQRTVQMQLQARDYKINQLKQDVTQGTKDPKFAQWLANDLKKPIYLEIGSSGSLYHDPRGFVLAEQASNGQTTYRDNSNANRLVVPPNSEVFSGGMSDPSAASVMSHEIGHMIMDQLYETPNYPKTNYYGPHSKNAITDEGFAISEGWAESIEALSTKDYHNTASSWRIKTHKNIADNKYVFKNQGVVKGVNDGILKTGSEMLSTEGVNASLFYDLMNSGKVQAPYTKITHVFENAKPQTYRDFVKSYVKMYPEDRSQVIRQFLEKTHYATVDPSATAKYKALFDAKQSYINETNPSVKSQLKAQYDTKLQEYKQWSRQLTKKAVVEGRIDEAVGGSNTTYSDRVESQYRDIRLSETLLKSKRALGTGLKNAASSIKQSFSVKSLAMTAGTSIAINLASQIMHGKKVSVKTAFKSVASLQFVGNVMGSTLGAAAGQVVTPLIQTFCPIPIVGTIAGALIPTLTSLVGGSFGGNLGAGMGFKEAIKALDPVALAGQAVGSTVGAMLGSMIPIPVVGTMIGSIVGGILGEKVFKGIAKLFGRKDKKTTTSFKDYAPKYSYQMSEQAADSSIKVQASKTKSKAREAYDPYEKLRIPSNIDRIPYNRMHPNLKKVKDLYEASYKRYVSAVTSGNNALAKKELDNFTKMKARYRRALGAYIK